MHHSVRVRKGEKDRVGFWWSWQCQAPSIQKEPTMSHSHLTPEERIGIELFGAMG